MTTTKSIGSGGSFDYATMKLAEAGLVSFDAGADMTDPWVFVVNNEVIAESSVTVWSGAYGGLSSTNTITIKPDFVGSGATNSSNTDCSFAGNNNYSSVALDYNGTAGKGAGFIWNTNGAAIAWTFAKHMVIQGLQFRGRGDYAASIAIAGTGNTVIQRCIIRTDDNSCIQLTHTQSSGLVLVANCLLIQTNENNGVPIFSDNADGSRLVANTICLSRHKGGGTTTRDNARFQYADSSKQIHDQNAFYHESPSTGAPYQKTGGSAAGGNYNVQNGNSVGASAPGANSSTAGVLATDLTDPTATSATDAVDFRPLAGGLLLGFIPSGSRYTGSGLTAGAADTDIRGQTRVGVNNDCGCFQNTVAGLPEGLRAANFTINF